MRRLLPTLLLLSLAACAPGAAAASGSCTGAAGAVTCRSWTGKVVAVDDGDTIDVDIDGDGTRRAFTVRFTAVQAMEQTRYSAVASRRRGECHALEATARVERLIRASRGRVRLTAQSAASHADRRLTRFVAVRVRGRWRDVGARLMAEGLTLFMASEIEPAWNRRYDLLSQRAALRGIGMWNPTHCGAGPSQDVPLRVWANWDPPGVDVLNLEGEWIKVQNLSRDRPLPLAGWWVRDSMLRRFTFPAGTTLAPGQIATVHTGPGPASGTTFHWGLDVPIFPNVGEHHLGDGAYLFDPGGDLRAAMTYPCLVACAHPDQGALALAVKPRREEAVWIRNIAGRPVDLTTDALVRPGSAEPFAAGTVLAPGESLRVDLPVHSLRDDGGSVLVRTFRDVALACAAWGDGRC